MKDTMALLTVLGERVDDLASFQALDRVQRSYFEGTALRVPDHASQPATTAARRDKSQPTILAAKVTSWPRSVLS